MSPVRLPRRPAHLPEYSEACLQALVDHGLADRLSLGGALGLLHYLDYRPTHDVDAWWSTIATAEDQRRVAEQIDDLRQRTEAEQVRAWFAGEFLNAAA